MLFRSIVQRTWRILCGKGGGGTANDWRSQELITLALRLVTVLLWYKLLQNGLFPDSAGQSHLEIMRTKGDYDHRTDSQERLSCRSTPR